MKKYVTYEKKEIEEVLNYTIRKINDVSQNLVVISQQLDGKRKNLDSSYAKEAYVKLQEAVESLNEVYKTYKIIPFEEALSNLEKVMKDDIY